jgi:hypothetical protein
MQRLRRIRIGVWLGVIAVALYAWLPGHFAGHVVLTALATLDASHGEPAPHRHAHHPAGQDEHHDGTCPICAAAAASAAPAAAMLPTVAALPAPRAMAAPGTVAEAHATLRWVSLTPYAPRGPPPAA